MKAAEWIDLAKARNGWDSDYRAAKELGISRATVSNYRTRTPTLDDESALKVASALGEAPEVVLLDQTMERTKNDEARTALAGLIRRLGGVAATVAMAAGIGAGMGAPTPAAAQATDGSVCILC